ncbi:hypothetical protein [Streptomyces roseochromogenus]|uniref:Lipoprotein n=1 Tax=Streptomyces roseochromogenus subsp. oscitans DS 12.976 TaxID=1352936 RepID=V6JYJ7_STRRC|nr:hypothetical protein [Streptomyces roseochromogenus]EST24186.1 hypothetical protein M878_31370 [Streptomyces roseochromogenus subsp. oscitans DS 12.976]
MKPSLRLLLPGCAALVAAGVATGCAATNGLAAGEPAPSVSAQPRPDAVWPAWSGTSASAPGAQASTHQPPPEPLNGLPRIGTDGLKDLRDLDVRAVLRADPRTRPYADRPSTDKPGPAGLRPPRYADLSGDGQPELLVAVDTENGRSLLAVFAARAGRVYEVLLSGGRQMTVETVGRDLVLRGLCADGAQQAVRFHWNGVRLVTVSDEKKYGSAGAEPTPSPAQSKGGAR